MGNSLTIGDYVFVPTCGEEGFVVGISSDGKIAVVQYLTECGPEEDRVRCSELEKADRPDGTIDIEEACETCVYLHHANGCTIQPGEYCKRYHRYEGEVQL